MRGLTLLPLSICRQGNWDLEKQRDYLQCHTASSGSEPKSPVPKPFSFHDLCSLCLLEVFPVCQSSNSLREHSGGGAWGHWSPFSACETHLIWPFHTSLTSFPVTLCLPPSALHTSFLAFQWALKGCSHLESLPTGTSSPGSSLTTPAAGWRVNVGGEGEEVFWVESERSAGWLLQ